MKQMKVLGVLAVALTLGLTACGGPNQKTCKHKWGDWEVVTAETCTTDGLQKRTCTVCKLVEEKKINKGHKWGAWAVEEASTCTEQGTEKRTCTRCTEFETRPLPLAPHTYAKDAQGEDVVVWSQEADCTNGGSGIKTCTECGHEEPVTTSALGHLYAKGDDGKDIVNWSVPASCEVDGVGTKACIREGCDHVEPVTEAKWGHKMVTESTEPSAEGEAAVRVYHCTNPGCDQTYFGFKATEVGPNSGRLVDETDPETGDTGKRFWGRPIGNAMDLTDDGSAANGADTEKVYDPTVEGDLFEYNFVLSQDQIDVMGDTVVCYADAIPANYLGGQDFWACDPTAEEWTPGYYIEGDNAGQPIADYRYILYVDDHPVEFNHKMKAPVTADGSGSQNQENLKRHEFLMPYIFHFNAGPHSISLRMAGGYRSVFFNFTFRPYEVPGDITVTPASISGLVPEETVQLASNVDGVTYKTGSASVATVSETGLVKAVANGSTKITVSKEGYFDTEVPVSVRDVLGSIKFSATEGFTSDPADAIVVGNVAQWGTTMGIKTFPKDATYSIKFNVDAREVGDYNLAFSAYGSSIADLSAAMSVKIDNNPVTVTGSYTAGQWGSASAQFGQANLTAGEHTLSITALGDAMPQFTSFNFTKVPEAPAHEYTVEGDTLEKEGYSTLTVWNCKDGDASALRWEAKDYDKTLSNEIEATADDGSIRFNRAQGKNGETDKGGHLVYKIDSPVAAKDVELEFYIQAHSANVAIFDAVSGDSGAGKDVDADGKYTVDPTKRYALYVNDVRVELGKDPGASTAKTWFTFPAKFDLEKGENKIEIVSLGGYRAKMYNFQVSGLPRITTPVHTWSSADIKNGLTAGNTLTEKDFGNSLEGVKGYKFNNASVTCTLTVNLTEGGTFALELLLSVKSGNQSKTGFWYQADSTQNPKPAKDKVTVNGTDVVPPANDVDFSDCTTESDQSDSGTLMVPQWKVVCDVTLRAGENTIVISYLSGGYSLYLCGARISK